MKEITDDIVTLRGVTVSREILTEKYDLVLNDTEWIIFKGILKKSWKEDDDELRKLVFKHLKKSLEQMDFKLKIEGVRLVFKSKKSQE